MTQHYSFTRNGVLTFLDDTVGDVMEAIHETGTYNGQLSITIGSRQITLPMVSETYEAIHDALHSAISIWESEYDYEGGKIIC